MNTRARNVPRLHKFIVLKGFDNNRKSIKPSDISCNELFCGYARLSVYLARQLSGKYAATLIEHLEYLEVLAGRRCWYNDKALIVFDENFVALLAWKRLTSLIGRNKLLLLIIRLNYETRRFEARRTSLGNRRLQGPSNL